LKHEASLTWGRKTGATVSALFFFAGFCVTGWLHNMVPVTLDNMVGGAVFVGMAYWFISTVRKKA